MWFSTWTSEEGKDSADFGNGFRTSSSVCTGILSRRLLGLRVMRYVLVDEEVVDEDVVDCKRD